jgi:hypothetical protein
VENGMYLAAAYSRRLELYEYAKRLEDNGFWVNARWVLEGHDIPEGTSDKEAARLRAKWAQEDWDDINKSTMVVSFTDGTLDYQSRKRGGRHVEFGIGLASDKEMVLIGPRENVFHHLPEVKQFADFEKFLKWLKHNR